MTGTNCGTMAATVCCKSKMVKVSIEFFGEQFVVTESLHWTTANGTVKISYWQSWVKVIPLKFFITNFFAAPGFVFTKGDVLFTPLGLLRAEKLALFWLFWVVSVILLSSCFNLLPIFSLYEEFLFLRVFTRSSPCWASWTWVLVRLDIEVHDTAVATLRVFLKNGINRCKILFRH